MKNVLKKNQIMITALAIMIAVAGYLNFAGNKLSDEELLKVSGESVVSDDLEKDTADILGEYNTSALEISDEDTRMEIESMDTDEVSDAGDYLDETMSESEGMQPDTPGEAVFTSTSSVTAFSGAKLLKEQTRAKNKETLLEIINSTNISEEQKQSAIEGMIKLTDIAEKETASEILLEAKGFEDVVVSISDEGVDVVVNADSLSDAQRAQIEDIVKRKTGAAPENIIIQCTK